MKINKKDLASLKSAVAWVSGHWDKIPDKHKTSLGAGGIPGLLRDEHIVVLLLDRQKPSIEPSYNFDEERLGVTRTGKVVWGFDSGCSCPSPWQDSYPACYKSTKTWKGFVVDLDNISFDRDWLETCLNRVKEIKKGL